MKEIPERDLIILQLFLKGKKKIDIARMVFGTIKKRELVNQIIEKTTIKIMKEKRKSPEIREILPKLIKVHG